MLISPNTSSNPGQSSVPLVGRDLNVLLQHEGLRAVLHRHQPLGALQRRQLLLATPRALLFPVGIPGGDTEVLPVNLLEQLQFVVASREEP